MQRKRNWKSASIVVAVAHATALALILLATGCSKKEPQTVRAPEGNKEDVPVRVTERGFEPRRIEVLKGTNATLVFTRVTDNTCAKDLIINKNGAHLELPLNQPVRIALGTVNQNIPFACSMNMVTGEVVAVTQ